MTAPALPYSMSFVVFSTPLKARSLELTSMETRQDEVLLCVTARVVHWPRGSRWDMSVAATLLGKQRHGHIRFADLYLQIVYPSNAAGLSSR